MLTSLRVKKGLDLHAYVPDIWHSALNNPNPNFVDGLAAHPPALATINNAITHPASTLATASQWDRFVNYKRLLVIGVDADAWVRSADGIPRGRTRAVEAGNTSRPLSGLIEILNQRREARSVAAICCT
jgi:hypothetical protein